MILITIASLGALASCGSSGGAARTGRRPVVMRARAAGPTVDRSLSGLAPMGAAALARQLPVIDAASLAVPDYLARRYDLAALVGAGAEARRRIRSRDHGGGSETLDALVVPDAPRPSAAALAQVPPYERAISAALYCRPTDAARLARDQRGVAAAGGYSLTHAAVAFEIGWERRCLDGGRADRLRTDLIRALDRAIRADAGATAPRTGAPVTISDLQVERVAMLALLGAPLPEPVVRDIATAHRTDGSWVDGSGRVPSWHTTMLATWVLAAAAGSGRPVPFVGSDRAGGSASGSAQFSPAEARRLPAPAPADRQALATLARDPTPTANEQVAMHDGMTTMGPDAPVPTPTGSAAVRLRAELASARRAAVRWSTPASARVAGFVLGSRFLPGVGTHYVDWARVTRAFDAAQPAMLLFDGDGAHAHLAGLSYLVRATSEPGGFRAGGAQWHRHAGLCIVQGVLVGEGVTRQQACANGRGTLLAGRDLWMLHVWVVPRYENGWGTFAPLNPALCDATRPCTP